VACWGEGVSARGVEGNAACVMAGEPEDAGVASYRAARQADHEEGAGGFREEHQGGYLGVL